MSTVDSSSKSILRGLLSVDLWINGPGSVEKGCVCSCVQAARAGRSAFEMTSILSVCDVTDVYSR